MEVIWLERKVKVIALSTVLIATILSGIAVMAYANGLNNGESTESAVMLNDLATVVEQVQLDEGGLDGEADLSLSAKSSRIMSSA